MIFHSDNSKEYERKCSSLYLKNVGAPCVILEDHLFRFVPSEKNGAALRTDRHYLLLETRPAFADVSSMFTKYPWKWLHSAFSIRATTQ
jgi:hypothetical protein